MMRFYPLLFLIAAIPSTMADPVPQFGSNSFDYRFPKIKPGAIPGTLMESIETLIGWLTGATVGPISVEAANEAMREAIEEDQKQNQNPCTNGDNGEWACCLVDPTAIEITPKVQGLMYNIWKIVVCEFIHVFENQHEKLMPLQAFFLIIAQFEWL